MCPLDSVTMGVFIPPKLASLINGGRASVHHWSLHSTFQVTKSSHSLTVLHTQPPNPISSAKCHLCPLLSLPTTLTVTQASSFFHLSYYKDFMVFTLPSIVVLKKWQTFLSKDTLTPKHLCLVLRAVLLGLLSIANGNDSTHTRELANSYK
jgi:hypothetical protein